MDRVQGSSTLHPEIVLRRKFVLSDLVTAVVFPTFMVSSTFLLMMGVTKNSYLLMLQRNGRMTDINCFANFIDGISLWRKIFKIIQYAEAFWKMIGLFLFNIGGKKKHRE
ncbi:unnamed protein product [Lathyrus sativus]|nr:unnamed protein product [Lathyrus sativus]